jgi:hypothetical protein
LIQYFNSSVRSWVLGFNSTLLPILGYLCPGADLINTFSQTTIAVALVLANFSGSVAGMVAAVNVMYSSNPPFHSRRQLQPSIFLPFSLFLRHRKYGKPTPAQNLWSTP